MDDYQLIDSGNCCKFEKFGNYTIVRPCDVAVWDLKNPEMACDAIFSRKDGNMHWKINKINNSWVVNVKGILLKLKLTPFGHLGLFYEHSDLWDKHYLIYSKIKDRKPNILNLFAYTGAGTVRMVKDNCFVTHVDASSGTMIWAGENLLINNFDKSDVRWICDDVMKFMRREVKRNKKYDGIILDPPSFGRGAKGEVFKLEQNLWELLDLCYKCIDFDSSSKFISLASHSEGFSDTMLEQIMIRRIGRNSGNFEKGILKLGNDNDFIQVGAFCIWSQ